MFGPNTHYTPVVPRNYSHRSEYAVELAGMVKHRLRVLFGLCDYDILLIPGPATVAMQTVINSAPGDCISIGIGKFVDRWRGMSRVEGKVTNAVYCLLETSRSFHREFTRRMGFIDIVDAVSAWPYYSLPGACDVFVTTSCKQLGAPPGLAIVGVRKDCWGRFNKTDDPSYTNIQNHRNGFYTTAPVNVLEVLENTLTADYFAQQRAKIDGVSLMLSEVLPPELTIGERTCPVITVKRQEFDQAFPGMAQKFQLYPETCRNSPTYHIFTYSEPFDHYVQFVNTLKDCHAAKH